MENHHLGLEARLERIEKRLMASEARWEESYREVVPIARQVMDVATVQLGELEKAGVFAAGQEALFVARNLLAHYPPEEIHRFGEALVGIMDTVRALTQPEVLEIASDMANTLEHADTVKPMGMFGVAAAMREEDVQRGLGVMVELLRQIGKAAHHVQQAPRSLKLPRREPLTPRRKVETSAPPPVKALEKPPVQVKGVIQAPKEGVDEDGWTEAMAEARAQELGVVLTETHWTVVRYLREQHASRGVTPNIRQMGADLGMNTKAIYALFPKAPGKSFAYVAGVPKPAGCI